MSKQDLSFSVSSQIIHPDDVLLTDMHTWTVYLQEYAPGEFTVFNSYSLYVHQRFEDEREAVIASTHTERPYTHRFDNLEEATYHFNHLRLQAFTALSGEALRNITETESTKCLISLLPND